MRALALHGPPVPSTAVLRYLKTQAQTLASWSAQSTSASRPQHRDTSGPSCGRRLHTASALSVPTLVDKRSFRNTASNLTTFSHGRALAKDREVPRHSSTVRQWTTYRVFSTTRPRSQPREVARRGSVWEKWHIKKPAPPTAAAQAGLLPSPLYSLLDDSTSLGNRLSKPSTDQRLRCTEFDEHGNVTLVNGEFKKAELIQKYGLQPRDLRKIDSSLLPNILVRPKAILMNLLHIRCLIQADRVLVFDAYGSTDSYTQSLFMYDLEGKLSLREGRGAGVLPYEFRALEAVLISVTGALESEFEGVRGPVVKVLRDLEENIDRDKLRMLLVLSKKLGTFEQRARLVRDAIDELLEADDDLAAMYLSAKKNGEERSEDDHTEVEMLLESYDKVCDEIVQVSGNLVSNIRNTEEIVKAILDANRNSLMLLDLKFSIGTLGLAAGTFIAALYGMNLKSFIEETDFGFPVVSATCFLLSVVACLYGMRKLRRVQRVSMWGEGGADGRHYNKTAPGASSVASRNASRSASSTARWWSRGPREECAEVQPNNPWLNITYVDRPEKPDWQADLERIRAKSGEWPDTSGSERSEGLPKTFPKPVRG